MRKSFALFLAIFAFLLIAGDLASQFYKVYGYKNLDANEKELVYWTTFIPSSDHDYPFFGDTVSRQGMFAHSLELEYGITGRLTVALFADFEQPRGQDFKWVRTKAVMLYYQLYDKNRLPVDMSLYLEYKLPRKEYEKSEEIWETAF